MLTSFSIEITKKEHGNYNLSGLSFFSFRAVGIWFRLQGLRVVEGSRLLSWFRDHGDPSKVLGR